MSALAAGGFGTMAVVAKLAYATGVNVVTLLAVRFTIAAVVLWLLALHKGVARVPSWRIGLVALGIGLGSYSLESGLFYASLTRIDASLAELLLFSYPAIVVLGAIALRRESGSRRRLVALGLATTGVGLVLAGGDPGALDPLGVALALGAALMYAIYVLVADALGGRLHPLTFAALVCSGAAIAFSSAGTASGTLHLALPASAWGYAAVIALLSTVLSLTAFLGGVARLGPGRASILSTLEPPITVAAAFIAFGEVLGPVQLLGGAAVIIAVLVLQVQGRIGRPWRSRSPRRSHPSSRVRARRSRIDPAGHTSPSSTASVRSRSSMIGS
jgi:drug/metabolite transporter (DMT)-like permease